VLIVGAGYDGVTFEMPLVRRFTPNLLKQLMDSLKEEIVVVVAIPSYQVGKLFPSVLEFG